MVVVEAHDQPLNKASRKKPSLKCRTSAMRAWCLSNDASEAEAGLCNSIGIKDGVLNGSHSGVEL